MRQSTTLSSIARPLVGAFRSSAATFRGHAAVRWHAQLVNSRLQAAPPNSLLTRCPLVDRCGSPWQIRSTPRCGRLHWPRRGRLKWPTRLRPQTSRRHPSSAASRGGRSSRQQAASTLALDFFTIETLALQRIYVLFFLSLATRRIEYVACTPNPDGRWVAQQARNLVMQLGEQERRFQLLIHDRDRKFSHAFDEVFRSEGIEVIRNPVQAPNANAFAERWVRTVRSDCLDRILILGRRHLERVLRVYTRHYNEHRPHRALQLAPPDGVNSTADVNRCATAPVRRRELLGGLIHEYRRAA
jgi:transposase InsO family protein